MRHHPHGLEPGDVGLDYKVMLYTIGLSFAAEMGMKGAHERTIGRLTAWLRGPKRTPEDEFALAMADDYAAFLRQTPWFEYPFASKLWQFWTRTPVSLRNPIRSLERRISLSGELAVKIVYAKLIGFGAAATPVPLTNRSVDQGPRRVRRRGGRGHHADRHAGGWRQRDRDAALPRLHRHPAEAGAARPRCGRDRRQRRRLGHAARARGSFRPSISADRSFFPFPCSRSPVGAASASTLGYRELMGMIRRLRGTNIELEHVYDY